jgi:hypothetical protein
MLNAKEKLLIQERVAEFAVNLTTAVSDGDPSVTTDVLMTFYDFLCNAFEMAKAEGRMRAIANSNSTN